MSLSDPVPRLPLATRMHTYEEASRGIPRIPPYRPFIIRLDGKNFSAFTKKYFQKPFDSQFSDTMIKTGQDLLTYFRPSTVYLCSDEISLVFPALCDKETWSKDPKRYTHFHGGRVDKLLSTIASYTGLRFFVNLPLPLTFEPTVSHLTVFDARLLLFPEDDPYEMVNHMIWREGDCRRNAISGYARYILGHKACQGLSGAKMIEEMDALCEKAWSEGPVYIKRGLYLKLAKDEAGHAQVHKLTKTEYNPDEKAFIQSFEEPLDTLLSKYFE